MGATTQKVYQLQIDSSQAEQRMQEASKLLADLKGKAQAANAEQRETQQVYRENVAALKELTAEQKRLDAATAKAAPGETWVKANAAAQQNLVTLKRLNTTVEESKLDYEAAKGAAVAAGAAVGKQATAVKELAAGVKDYKTQAAAAAQEFAPGTFGAISQEVEALKARLLDLAPGSAEAAQAIQQLADKQSALRQLANATNSANPRAQARAFGVLSGALLGLTSVVTTSLQVWGLSEQNAQKYGQAIQGVVSVLYSAEQINKLLNSENLSLIKGIWAQALAWVGLGKSATAAGVAAEEGAVVADAALTSTGIGAILVGIGVALMVVVALWEKFSSGAGKSTSAFTQFKATVVGGLSALWDATKSYYKILFQLITFDFPGALASAKEAGSSAASSYSKARQEIIAEAHRAELKVQNEQMSRYLDIIKSKGEDALALEVELARRKVEAEKAGSKERLDAVRDYLVLKNQMIKRAEDEEDAHTIAHLNALASIVSAQGKNNFTQELATKQEHLLQLLAADRINEAAVAQAQGEIQALKDAHEKDLRDRREAAELAALDRSISLQKAKGREAFELTVAREEQELAFLKTAAHTNAAAIIAQQAKIADLKAARQIELTERAHAAELAALDASIGLQNAKGEESYRTQVAREERQLQFLRQAGIVSLAAIRTQLGKIESLRAAHALKEEAEERAAILARLNASAALLRVHGEDMLDIELEIKQRELTALLEAATKNEAAIVQKQNEIDVLLEQQQVTAAERKRARMIEDFENEVTLREKHGKDTLARRIKFQQAIVALDEQDTSEAGITRLRADLQKLAEMHAEMTQRGPDLGVKILQKFFGVKEEDVQQVKAKLNEAFSQVSNSVGQLANSFLEAAVQATQQALDTAQQQLQEASQQLSQMQSQAEATAAKLDSAQGARKNYLLDKLAKERTETERLASVKAKAAAEEKKQQEEQHRLQKLGIELSSAATLASNIAASAKAVEAGVSAIKEAAGSPWPTTIPAIIAAIASVVATVASAKSLANAVKYQDGTGALGSDGVLRGPSHAGGGIQLFGRSGVHWGEAEGGEAVTPVDATQKNGPLLQMLRTVGRSRTLTPADIATISQIQVAPPPKSYLADGGILSKGAAVSGGYASASSVANLQAEQQRTNALLAALLDTGNVTAQATTAAAQHTAATAQHTAELKDKDPTVRWDFEAEQSRRNVGQQLDQAEGFLKG